MHGRAGGVYLRSSSLFVLSFIQHILGMHHFVCSNHSLKTRLHFVVFACILLSRPCTATVFTGSISRSDPPSAVLVARFNFREYTESRYTIQASNAHGFFALFDDETIMLRHLEKGLSSSSSNECMSYLMSGGKGVGPYRALPPAQLESGWSEGIIGNYCRDWFFVFFNCQASLLVPSYRIETLTDNGSQLPCGKGSLPFLLLFFAALTCLFVAFMFQKHGRGVLDVANSAFVALCGCACTSLSCTLMGLHYYRMRDDGVGSHTSNFIGRAVLQAAQVALLLHAFRFSSSLSLQHVWSKLMQSRAAQYFTYAAAAAYAVVCICSLTADSSESIIASAQPVNSYGRALAAFQLAFAAFATHFYRRACRLEYADSSFKLKCYTVALALPWLWALPTGTLLCLLCGAKDQLVAVYAVQLSLTTVYCSASALVLFDHVPNDDPQHFDEPRFFDDGL
jgi:hypothetical protein